MRPTAAHLCMRSRPCLAFRLASSQRALILVVFIALAPIITRVASGQTPASPDISSTSTAIRTVTRAIVLDVVASDERGELVRGLTREDFSILEDGTAQAIASFDSSAVSEAAIRQQAPDNRQTTPNEMADTSSSSKQTILVLDEMNTSFIDASYARFCLNKFLHQNGGGSPTPRR
jgi:hypothetical protein